jgi:hypothetical protein
LIVAVAFAFAAWIPGSGGVNRETTAAAVADEPQVCSGCQPPLSYLGGPVMGSTGAGVTVTPIYWEPGGKYKFAASYEDVINGYVSDVAAASGQDNNVYSVPTEYYQVVGGVKTPFKYVIHAGTPIVDTTPFPSDGCTADKGYTACLTDDQLRTELSAVTSGQKLPTDLAHFYPVFFPPGVETQDADGTTSASTYCGYHRAFGSGANQTVYADMPIVTGGTCDAGQSPNGNVTADGEVSTLSHELIEAITDPLDQRAWNDRAGNEIGDMCGQTYREPLGSTDPSNPGSSEYNQVINGGKYYLQTEFSNAGFAKFGLGKGCSQSEALAQGTSTSANPGASTTSAAPGTTSTSHAAQAQNAGSLFAEATPTALAADGHATSQFVVSVADADGNARVGDHVHFSVGAQSATGKCGTLSTSDTTTDHDGYARVTYTASTDNIACWVLAVDAAGGQSAQSVVYQGTTQKNAATMTDTFPTTLEAGGPTTTFIIKAQNPSTKPLPNARLTFDIYGEAGAKGVDASQIHLSYSTTGADGTFTDVPLDGSTGNGNSIETGVGPDQGATLAPHATVTYTFHVTLASNVPASESAGPVMAFEGYLDQINTASGSGDTLADTYSTDIKVPTATAPPDHTLRNVLIGIAAAAVVVLAVLGVLFWRRRKGHPPAPTPGAATP